MTDLIKVTQEYDSNTDILTITIDNRFNRRFTQVTRKLGGEDLFEAGLNICNRAGASREYFQKYAGLLFGDKKAEIDRGGK